MRHSQFDDFQGSFDRYEKILLPNSHGFNIVNINQIIRLEADSNYTRVILSNGKKLMVSWTLKRFEKLLSLPVFFRSHRSYIIHLDFVRELVTKDGWYVTFPDKAPIPVSRKNRDELIKRLISRSDWDGRSQDGSLPAEMG